MHKVRRTKVKAMKVNATRNKYSKYYENAPIDDKLILYITNRPVNISGNSYALFHELIENSDYDKFIHYWVVSNRKVRDEEKIAHCENHPRVKLIKVGTLKYLEALAKAKYIIYERQLPTFFMKKEGQICINAWDDIPLRKIGIHENTKSTAQIWNTQKNLYFCDYLVSPNHYTTEKLFQAYNLKGLFSGTVVETGHLSNSLLNKEKKEPLVERLERELNCNFKGHKIILYSPAARKIDGKFLDNSKVIQNHISKISKGLPEGYVLLTKLEPSDSDSFVNKKIDFLLAPDEIENRKLFAIADILIADYNNMFMEFLGTGRPFLFFDYDRERSGIDEEAYIPIDTLPGPICTNVKQLLSKVKSIDSVVEEYRDVYKAFAEIYAPYNDGLAANRAVSIIFGNKDKQKELSKYTYTEVNHKKKVLVHIGLLNQISERELCFHILKQMDYDNNVVVVDGNDIYAYQNEFSRINKDILVVNSKYENNKTFFEKKYLRESHNIKSKRKLFNREFKSMYGGIDFDTVIDTVGKKSVWMNAFSSLLNTKKILMINEAKNSKEVLEEYVEYLDEVVVVDGSDDLKAIDSKITCIPKDGFIESSGIHSLNVLFLSAFDSTNYVFVNLIKVLTARGHHCTVIVKDKEDAINNKMYIQENIPFIDIDEFNIKLVSFVDFVFSAPLKYDCYNNLYKKLNAADKFIITFASLFSSIVMGVNPDLALAIGTSKFDEFEENGLKYNLVAIGNPQYDRLIKLRQQIPVKDINQIKNVLIIEQGAYPYGHVGKTQLADVLCHIARSNPDKRFTIKPRYLPSEKGKQLHVLSEHLYDYIDNRPENLILLDEPVVLEDIMQEFDAAITTWSTAYLDAAILGLPIILIEGLDSTDVYNVRRQRIQAAYDRLRHSGCVVNFKDLYNNPLPFKFVDEKYLSEEIYDPQNPCVPKILEVLEYLYRELIVTEKRWKNIYQFEFSEFKEKSHQVPLIDVRSSEFQNRKRLFNETNKILQKFIFENRCMGQVMDVTSIYDFWNYNVTEETTKGEITEALKALREETNTVRDKFFTNHMDMVHQDRILQDYYFQWLFMNQRYHDILNYTGELICPESLYFYKAVVLYTQHHYKSGTQYMAKFLEISGQKETKDLRKDMALSAYLWKGRLGKYLILHYLDKYQAYEAIGAIDSQNTIYQRDIMLYYRVKSLMKRGMDKEALDMCKEYSQTMLKKSKSRNIKQRIKYFIGKRFYSKTEALVKTAKENMKK